MRAEALVAELLAVMARLRDPHTGCRWDLAQDFRSIAPYTIEEAYEVADAIERADSRNLRDELGDLLFQVVFHARMAQELGWFDFADVVASIRDKLVRRHPHVFGPQPQPLEGPALERLWEEQKAQERDACSGRADNASALADVPLALPALARAAKLGRRAARVGFDWRAASHVRAKVLEEWAELDAELLGRPEGKPPSNAAVEEFGDLLLALVNWGRHLRIDPEAALRQANYKFEGRFRHMETLARVRNLQLQALTPESWEQLWSDAKGELGKADETAAAEPP